MPCTAKNLIPIKFCDLKQAEFCVIFGAKEFVRLSPTNDDKPKSTEIMPFKAGSDYSCLLKLTQCYSFALAILSLIISCDFTIMF